MAGNRDAAEKPPCHREAAAPSAARFARRHRYISFAYVSSHRRVYLITPGPRPGCERVDGSHTEQPKDPHVPGNHRESTPPGLGAMALVAIMTSPATTTPLTPTPRPSLKSR